ncbi:DEAD/DEAH box helicase [Amycolatopsis balhimycina DSM 5908]|uniref:DEAD/DEAH box helicase n=1 Tax=Amycolatopsis balhimycina DSM 5908 TaxID=1081091 RepID=A0A428W424_AMYBA|nr:DEAD/DEAH box helicase [Amycolatopsis balhimycina]RSM37841.1 DEAD/DEAH box helicase [Amycolatopsis balhimycina DSM 5908]
MRFHGTFIGIDRYQAADIGFLTSAVRDATALHALFTDGFDGEPALLTDADATRAKIVEELRRLAASSSDDDLVVVSFSGHGSTTHELVPYDADRARLEETGLPLEDLAELLNQIPAATLICVLDCCFSGGFGAKALTAPLHARGLESELDLLEHIAGHGRIVLAASAPNERAYEDPGLGHGLLTYELLTALQGAPEVVSGGKIDVYKLLEHVTRRVVDASSAVRKEQHPCFRGSLAGTPTWPILTPGARYAAAFPEFVRQPATADLDSLASFGIPQVVLDTWGRSIAELNALQLAAINDFGVLDGKNLLVTAPTSSGKTMVGELAALRGAVDHQRALFLLPMRALVDDKYAEFTRKYADLGVVTIRSTGEISDDNAALMSGRYDICLMTYEKFGSMILANPYLLRQVGTIVVDEVQMLVDPGRGADLEFVLTLVKSRRAAGINPQIICLSAVIGDTGGLERWLDGRQLRREERPVPLVEGVVDGTGQYRYLDEEGQPKAEKAITPLWSGKNSSQDVVIPLVAKLVSEGKQVIVFRETKGETLGCAGYLSAQLGLPPAQAALDALPTGDLSTSSERLHKTLAGGVGFHNADLTREERLVLEEEFRRRDTELRVLVATTTLAMGVNTPASAVVIVGLNHFSGPYTVAEYKNMVGRAGRLGYAEHGESYIVGTRGLDVQRIWSRYVTGRPEDVKSVFLKDVTDHRTQVLRTLAALQPGPDGSVESDVLISFLESTFAAFQQRQANPGWSWGKGRILGILSELQQHQLIEIVDGGRYRPTDLGRFAGEGGVFVDSIIRLVEVLRHVTAQPNSTTLITAAQVTKELDDVHFPFHRKARNTEHRRWPQELMNQQVEPRVQNMLRIGGTDQLASAVRAKKAMACLLYASSTPLGVVEQHLMQHNLGNEAAGAIRSVAGRTRDLVPAVMRVFTFLHPDVATSSLAERTMVRLELGIPAELVDLGMVLGAELTRAQYLALLGHGITTPDEVEASDVESLADHLNVSTARAAELQAFLHNRERQSEESFVPLLPPPTE